MTPAEPTAAADRATGRAEPPPSRRWWPRRLVAPSPAAGIAIGVALPLAAWLLAAVHGLLPGQIRFLPVAYAYSGFIECLSEQELLSPPVCESVGLPVGFVPLTDGPYLAFTSVLRRVTGLAPLAAKHCADAALLALSFACLVALQRRLGVRLPIAVPTAVCFLYLQFLLGHSGIYAYFVGILLLPAYLLVELAFFRRVTAAGDGARRPLGLAAAALGYAAVRILALFQDPYTWVMAVAVSAVLLAFATASLLGRRRFGAAAGLGAGWALSVAVAVGLYRAWVPGGADYEVMPLDFFRAQGVDLISLFVPSASLWWAKLLDVGVWRWNSYAYFGDGTNVEFNYLGYVLLVPVAAYGARALLRRRSGAAGAPGAARAAGGRSLPRGTSAALAVAALLCLAVSFGPSLKLNDARDSVRKGRFEFDDYMMPRSAATLTLPTERLFVTAPGLKHMRAIYRWIVVPKLILLIAFAWVASRVYERRPALGLALAALALVEQFPDLGALTRLSAERHQHYRQFNRDVTAELGRYLVPGERVFFLSKGNDYLVNYLVPRLDVESYNVGGDKNGVISRREWPLAVQKLRDRAGEPGGARRWIARALAAEDVDAVVIPYFDLRWHAYAWPPSEREREERRAVGLVGIDPAPPPLQVAESWWFAVVGVDPNRPRTGLAGALVADPNPVVICDGSRFGETVLSWRVRGPSEVEIRVDAPDGRLFARVGPEDSAPTGKWVRDGTEFFLQDLSRDRPLTPERTLARLRVRVTSEGCDPPPAPAPEAEAAPAP